MIDKVSMLRNYINVLKRVNNPYTKLGTSPDILTGTYIEDLLACYENKFGMEKIKNVIYDFPFIKIYILQGTSSID